MSAHPAVSKSASTAVGGECLPVRVDVRPAVLEDAGSICTVIRRSIAECCEEDHHGDPNRIEAWLRNKTVTHVRRWLASAGNSCFVALRNDVVVGFAMSHLDEVLLCYVAPELRLTGVGKALLQAMEKCALETGTTSLRLESTRTAQPFYRRNGFSATGPQVAMFGMESLPMSKSLKPIGPRPPPCATPD